MQELPGGGNRGQDEPGGADQALQSGWCAVQLASLYGKAGLRESFQSVACWGARRTFAHTLPTLRWHINPSPPHPAAQPGLIIPPELLPQGLLTHDGWEPLRRAVAADSVWLCWQFWRFVLARTCIVSPYMSTWVGQGAALGSGRARAGSEGSSASVPSSTHHILPPPPTHHTDYRQGGSPESCTA